jgi:hypothetical protein
MDMVTRIYADTSVFGGVFDEEFRSESIALFDMIRQGKLNIVTSALVAGEIGYAPEEIQTLFAEIAGRAEMVEINNEALDLRDSYIDAGVVSSNWGDDALHVALASVARCVVIVSWNFKHIVHYQKIPRYNEVNLAKGYAPIAIHSPMEVITYEE